MNKYDKWFGTVNIESELRNKSVKGGVSTVFGQVASFGIRLFSLFVLARILSPEEFGIVAMVTSISGIVDIIKDLGLSSAIIQRENLYQSQLTALFWINAIISLILGLIIGLSGLVMVEFYTEPRLLKIALVFAVGIFISGLSMQHNALMKRQMRFKNLALFQIVGSSIATLVGICLGLLGFSYWAIVYMNISGPIIMALLLWIKCDWRPGKPAFRGVKNYLQFGAGISGFNIVNYLSRNADNIIIGKVLDAATLGLYSKAYQLLLLPINQLRNPLNSVGIPSLSALRNDKIKYVNYYRRFVFVLGFVSMPVVAFMYVYSYELIITMLGKKWSNASEIFSILAIASFIQPVASSRGLVMISWGLSTRYFYWGLVNAICVIASFLIGIKWGVLGLASAYAAVNYIILYPSLLFSFRHTPVKSKDFFDEIFITAVFSILTGFISFSIKSYLKEYLSSSILLLIIGLIIFCLGYLGFWLLFPGSRKKIFNQKKILQEIFRK